VGKSEWRRERESVSVWKSKGEKKGGEGRLYDEGKSERVKKGIE